MTFEEDAMDAAYKSLEGTEKFCSTSKKFSDFFSSSSQPQKLTPHQRLYRKSIVADCLLFEAILVFIRQQSLTSYVKGGYLIRKAWKLYEKVYSETEELCTKASPISKPGMFSPVDKHVGASLYDDKGSFLEEGKEEDGGDEGDIRQTVAAIGDTLAMQLGFGLGGDKEGEGEEGGKGKGEGETGAVQNGDESSSSSPSNSPETRGLTEIHDTPGKVVHRVCFNQSHTCIYVNTYTVFSLEMTLFNLQIFLNIGCLKNLLNNTISCRDSTLKCGRLKMQSKLFLCCRILSIVEICKP